MIPRLLISRQLLKKLVLKIALFYILILLPLPLCGQVALPADTISIEEVVIKRKSAKPGIRGYKVAGIDSVTRSINYHNTIADLLTRNASLFIRNYGPGGIATISFRGTGAGQTQIAWNDVPINNPMLGQFDLSLVPAGLIDEVKIHFGGSSMGITSGGIGGAINLETKPSWKRETRLFVNPAMGSFGRYSGLAKIITGNTGFHSVTKAFIQSSENDFRYLNTFSSSEPVWEIRDNNRYLQKGFLQELHFKGLHNELSARFWYQASSRSIPAPVISMQPPDGETQSDESLRSVMNYGFQKSKYDLNITAALLTDKLNYLNRLTSTDSRNNNLTAFFKASAESKKGYNLRLKMAVSNELNIINSNNYDDQKIRNATSATISSVFYFTENIISNFLVRGIMLDNKLLSPDFSSGLEIRIASQKDLIIKANVSKNSKIPSLNDMYWVPGGNPDLKSETGYTGEISLGLTGKNEKPFGFSTELTFFGNSVRDMIQWQPGSSSYWSAENIGRVKSMGFESETVVSYSVNRFNADLNAGYAFTRAFRTDQNDVSIPGKRAQLTYTPVNQFNTGLNMSWKELYAVLTSDYTSRRFLTVDNSSYLPGYLINDLVMGIRLSSKKYSLDMNLSIYNLFNANYQIIAWYPLPGRSFHAGISVQIRTKK